jgi:uncharacterized membrane protein YjfL (UPF0719 family)
MHAASEFVKFGGFVGFSSVFLLVLLRDRDIVAAVSDASIACVVMALAFRQFANYTHKLDLELKKSRKTTNKKKQDPEEGLLPNLARIRDLQT